MFCEICKTFIPVPIILEVLYGVSYPTKPTGILHDTTLEFEVPPREKCFQLLGEQELRGYGT